MSCPFALPCSSLRARSADAARRAEESLGLGQWLTEGVGTVSESKRIAERFRFAFGFCFTIKESFRFSVAFGFCFTKRLGQSKRFRFEFTVSLSLLRQETAYVSGSTRAFSSQAPSFPLS